jgi:hypothetical protein
MMKRKYYADILLRINALLANGEVLFVCNGRDAEMWMQAYAFYDYGGCLYAVTKDFAGIFTSYPNSQTDSFIQCRAYFLTDDYLVVNNKSEVVVVRKDNEWTLPHRRMTLEEFTQQIQSNEDVDKSRNDSGNESRDQPIQPSSRYASNSLYQWFRRIFTKKSLAAGRDVGVP